MEKIKNLCIIQARISSTRLKNKMLLHLGKKKIIEHVVDRVILSKKCDHFILATSNMKEDYIFDEIFDNNKKIEIFHGDLENVLSRFIEAGKKYNPINIIRVCADNPFIDYKEIDKLVNFHENGDYDYSFNNIPLFDNNYPDGLGAEIIRFDKLNEIYKITKDKKYIEHVTLYVKDNINNYKIGILKAESKIAYPEVKLDIDNMDDYKYMLSIYEKLKHIKYFDSYDIIKCLIK